MADLRRKRDHAAAIWIIRVREGQELSDRMRVIKVLRSDDVPIGTQTERLYQLLVEHMPEPPLPFTDIDDDSTEQFLMYENDPGEPPPPRHEPQKFGRSKAERKHFGVTPLTAQTTGAPGISDGRFTALSVVVIVAGGIIAWALIYLR